MSCANGSDTTPPAGRNLKDDTAWSWKAKTKKAKLLELAREIDVGAVTLLYAAKDRERNNAVVLREELSRNY